MSKDEVRFCLSYYSIMLLWFYFLRYDYVFDLLDRKFFWLHYTPVIGYIINMAKVTNQKSNLIISLKKSIGTIKKTIELLDQNADCDDVLTQLDSSIGSLNASRRRIIEGYIDICILDEIPSNQKSSLSTKLKKLYKLTK